MILTQICQAWASEIDLGGAAATPRSRSSHKRVVGPHTIFC